MGFKNPGGVGKMTGILIIATFVIFALLMIFRKISTIMALILMGIFMAIEGGVPLLGKDGLVDGIFAGGTTSLAATSFAVIFGGWLGAVMEVSGIASTLVKKAVEFGGDRPYLTAFFIMIVAVPIGLITGSAPAAMLIGLVGLPAMLALGLSGEVASTVILFGLGAGWASALYIWKYFSQILNLSVDQVAYFGVRFVGIVLAVGIVFLLIEATRAKRRGKVAWPVSDGQDGDHPKTTITMDTKSNAPWYALITPLIPIVFVLAFKWDILPSFFIAILYGLLTTKPKQFNQLFLKSAYRGFEVSASPVYIFVGVGILAKAISSPLVTGQLRPVLEAIVPTSALGYILFFAILAPLAIYRGPLNIFGLGGGVAAIMISTHVLPPMLVLGAMAAVAQVLYISDPTSTQVVWSAEYAGSTPEKVMLKSIPYTWATAILGVLLSAILFMH
jgi:TRAP-type transport system large permease protein